jgi:phage-related tail fiber protein
MAEKNVIVTKTARKKMAQARAGVITLPKIVGMAFGDGGTDSSGKAIAPSESQTTLNHELYRKAIKGYTFTSDTTCRYECTLAETELGGEDISEIGLYDAEGDILSIKNFTKKGKDDDMEMTFTLDDVF